MTIIGSSAQTRLYRILERRLFQFEPTEYRIFESEELENIEESGQSRDQCGESGY
jgi:hypothetical protein